MLSHTAPVKCSASSFAQCGHSLPSSMGFAGEFSGKKRQLEGGLGAVGLVLPNQSNSNEMPIAAPLPVMTSEASKKSVTSSAFAASAQPSVSRLPARQQAITLFVVLITWEIPTRKLVQQLHLVGR